MSETRLIKHISRMANRFYRAGLLMDDAMNLAFAESDLDLPITDGQGSNRVWAGYSKSGNPIAFEWKGVRDAGSDLD